MVYSPDRTFAPTYGTRTLWQRPLKQWQYGAQSNTASKAYQA